MICPYCGSQTDGTVKFCHICGHRIEQFAPKVTSCPRCGQAVAGSEKFCPACGNALGSSDNAPSGYSQNTNICSSCGAELDQGAKFCRNCGAPTAATSASVTAEIPVDRTAVYSAPAPAYQPASAPAPDYQAVAAFAAMQAAPQKKKGSGAAVTGLVLGILALLGWFVIKNLSMTYITVIICIVALGSLLSLIGLIVSIVGAVRASGGMRIAAIIGIAASVVAMVLLSIYIMDIVKIAMEYGMSMVMQHAENLDLDSVMHMLEYYN